MDVIMAFTLNEDVINLILSYLSEIADSYEIHDFMETSKEIYDLSLNWRKNKWSFGNIIMKPYQDMMLNNIYNMVKIYLNEDIELNKLLLIDAYFINDIIPVFFTTDLEGLRKSAEKYGVLDKFTFFDENGVESFDEIIKNCSNIIADSKFSKYDGYQDSYTDDTKSSSCPFTNNRDKADYRMILRSSWHSPIINYIDIIDFSKDVLCILIKKIFENTNEIVISGNHLDIIDNIYGIAVSKYKQDGFENDPNRKSPTYKKIYIASSNSSILLNNIILFNSSNDNIDIKSIFIRTINVYRLTTTLYRYLIVKFSYSRMIFDAIEYTDFTFSVVRMLGYSIKELSKGDLAVLFAINPPQERYYYWLYQSENKLSEIQVRRFLSIDI